MVLINDSLDQYSYNVANNYFIEILLYLLELSTWKYWTNSAFLLVWTNFCNVEPLPHNFSSVVVWNIIILCQLNEFCTTVSSCRHYRALDSFVPLVALLRLTFSVGRMTTSFGRFFFFFFFNIWLINACRWTFIIVYSSYMVTKVFNVQPVLFHQYYLWFKFWKEELPFTCTFTFKFVILVKQKMYSLLLVKKNNNNKTVGYNDN